MIFDMQRFVTYGTSGDDTIRNSQNRNEIYAYGGNDSIYNNIGYATIYAGDGNDTVQNQADGRRSYIDGGNGDDYIYGFFAYSELKGGDGDDTIYLRQGDGYGSYTTIIGGTGNDTIRANGGWNRVYMYEDGDGDDVIYYARNNDTLYVDSEYYTTRSGSDFIVNFADGSVTFKNISSMNIVGGEYSDSTSGVNIDNTRSYVSLTGSAGNDTIYNRGTPVTIDAGDGNDSISGKFDYSSVSGGAGDDIIRMNIGHDDYATINPGAGNDTVYMENYDGYNLYQYNEGDGNDVVYYLKANDTLDIAGGSITGASVSGNDVILGVGSGSLTLKNTRKKYFWLKNGTSDAARTEFIRNGSGAHIINSAPNISLTGATPLNDTISNTGSYVTIDAGDGNDRILNVHNNFSYVNAGEGNDYISLLSGGVTVSAGAGDDTIYANSGKNRGVLLLYEKGDGNDIVYGANAYTTLDLADTSFTTTKSGSNLIVSVEGGALTFKSTSSVQILGSTSGVNISNSKSYTVINGTASDDTIYNSGKHVSITTGTGDDSIYNYSTKYYGNYITVDAGAGNDTISGRYGDSSISAGAGNDVIDLSYGDADDATVNGGEGDDLIYNDAHDGYNLFLYKTGDGNDTIIGFTKNDTLKITGSYTTVSSGNDLIYNVGSGSILLKDYNPGGVNITNSDSNRTLTGTSHNDTISNVYTNGGDTVLIDAGAGDDRISNDWGYEVTIDAGAGNDTITVNKASSNSINAGAGDDLISLSASQGLVLVRGGTGNDTIYGDSTAHIYQYDEGDGEDILYGYNARDTITISGGEWSSATVGNDVVISVSNSTVQTGAITLSGAKGKAINVYGEMADDTGTSTLPAGNQQQVIQTFMGVLDTVNSDGVSRLNQAVSVASGGYFSNISAAINQMVNDCRTASSANDFLLNKCGINLSNADTGAITGSDAGGSEVKTATSIVPESGSVNNFTGSSFTTNGLTIQLASVNSLGEPIAITYNALTTDRQRYVWKALQTWWAQAALNLNAQSYGSNYGFDANSSATVNKLYFGFERENSGVMATTYFDTNSSGDVDELSMTVNMSNYNSLIIGNSDGKNSGEDDFYLDRVLSHEFTHAVMGANIRYFNGLPDFIAEGMAELTHGADDDRADEILSLAGSPTSLRSALSLSYGNYNSYAGGYMFLRYLAKQSAEHSSTGGSENMADYVASINSASRTNVTAQRGISISGAVLTVANNFDGEAIDLSGYSSSVTKVKASANTGGVMVIGSTRANSITGGRGNDTVSGNLGNDTISGGAGNDVLYGDAGNDKISGDAGDDTLVGGYGNDTLTGGAGSDVFIHVAGKDLITDYAAGQDKIKLVEEDILSASVSGSNVVLTTTNGAITVKGGKNKQLTVIDRNGVETTGVYPVDNGITVSGAVLTAKETFTGETIDLTNYATTVKKVNAANLTRGVEIIGSAAANSLKGGSGNDTLSGGAGNDTLRGGAGADVFVYESGNDVITDYAAGQDKIKLACGEITGSSLSGSNVVLQIGSGKVTVKGGKNKQLTVIDADGKETTQIYGASGRSALWFTEDDTNLLGEENSLDAISAEKFAVTQVETSTNFETLAQGDLLSAAVTFEE